MRKHRSIVSQIALIVVSCIIGYLGAQWMGDDEEDVTSPAVTAVSRDVRFEVPKGWTLVTLSATLPCPPDQKKLVVIAEAGLGGDCPSPKEEEARISVTRKSPLEVVPPTTVPIGAFTGWEHKEDRSSTKLWVVVVPDKDVQLSFSGPINDEVRTAVVRSLAPA